MITLMRPQTFDLKAMSLPYSICTLKPSAPKLRPSALLTPKLGLRRHLESYKTKPCPARPACRAHPEQPQTNATNRARDYQAVSKIQGLSKLELPDPPQEVPGRSGYTILYYTRRCYTALFKNILYYPNLYCTILYHTILCVTTLRYTTLCYTILYYTILYYTILYYTILYYTILYYTSLNYTVLYCTILYYTVLYYTILYYAVLYCTVLYCTVLHCTVLYYNILCTIPTGLD